MIERRTFLMSSTAALAVLGVARGGVAFAQGASAQDQKLDQMLSGWFQADLRENPTFATNLGLDVGEMAGLRGQLGEASLEEAREDRERIRSRNAELERFDRAGLTPAGELNYDIAAFRYSVSAQGTKFEYGSAGGRPAPYVVSQLGGAYYSTPDFLDTQHPLKTAQDAEYYLSRVEGFARNLDQEVERIRHDASLGVVPPDFVVDKALGNLEALRKTPPAETTVVRSIARRTGEAGIAGDWGTRAEKLVTGSVNPALDRQIAELRRIRPQATHDAGVWKLPDGEAYYDWGIRSNTTTTMTGEEIHRTGLEQVAELQGRLDGMLKAQGYTKGTVGDRLNAMNKESRFVYPNTDAGREEMLQSLNAMMADLAPRLPRVFGTIPKAAVEIRRVPVAIEAGAPGGYYQGASLDGSRPGAYYINLKDTAEWPKHSLPTLTYHEASPGHHFQISISREAGDLPLYRRVGGFSAYNEGWALYAERVADELGVYENDPFGRIGYLQSYLFRAVRLVVDSGLHHKRWSREQAIKYMVDNSAFPEGASIREIERYSVWPGQACAYKIGQTVIAGLRDEAERKQGRRFDIKAFHAAVLNEGSMPLEVLQRRVRRTVIA